MNPAAIASTSNASSLWYSSDTEYSVSSISASSRSSYYSGISSVDSNTSTESQEEEAAAASAVEEDQVTFHIRNTPHGNSVTHSFNKNNFSVERGEGEEEKESESLSGTEDERVVYHSTTGLPREQHSIDGSGMQGHVAAASDDDYESFREQSEALGHEDAMNTPPSPSFLHETIDDREDVFSLSPVSQSSNYGDNPQPQTNTFITNEDSTTCLDISELCEAVREIHFQRKLARERHIHKTSKNATQDNTDNHKFDETTLAYLNYDLTLRIQDFHRARKLRRSLYGGNKPWGVFGLFMYLSELRRDLEWAEDAAWRRKRNEPYLAWADYEALNRSHTYCPSFVIFIMIVSTATLVISFWLNDWKFALTNVNPMFGPTPEVLIEMGALETTRVVENFEYWRLVTPIVLHAGLIHFFFNMSALWFLGGAVERYHGTLETSIIFVVSGIGGNLLSVFLSPYSITVGASGSIFGLLGVCLADIMVHRELLSIRDEDGNRPFSLLVFFWLSIELFICIAIGLTPYIDNFVHIGGLFYGVTLGVPILRYSSSRGFFRGKHQESVEQRIVRKCNWLACRGLSVALAVTLFSSSLILLLTTDNPAGICPSCRYISCVPLPFWNDDKWWYCDGCELVTASLYTSSNVESRVPAKLELICPLGGHVATVELEESKPDPEVVRSKLQVYCREYCLQ